MCLRAHALKHISPGVRELELWQIEIIFRYFSRFLVSRHDKREIRLSTQLEMILGRLKN